jgi:hypothetical protein
MGGKGWDKKATPTPQSAEQAKKPAKAGALAGKNIGG